MHAGEEDGGAKLEGEVVNPAQDFALAAERRLK